MAKWFILHNYVIFDRRPSVTTSSFQISIAVCGKMKASESVLLDKFNRIIESNFHNSEFGIDEICHELGTSRSHLYRHIKEQTQLSTSLYIRKRKLIKARELLKSSEMKTAEIAYFLGIDSPQNFSKYFTQEFGLSPTAYRKQVAVEKLGHESEAVTDPKVAEQTSPEVNTLPPRYAWTRIYFYGALVLLLGATLAFYFLRPVDKTAGKDALLPEFSGNSIAVMPFRNLGMAETAYFCEGIMDQIHGSLSLLAKLKVISTTSSKRYKNSPKSVLAIAKELDVNYILEGSVLQAGKKIRINVELVRAADDRTVWTKSYDGDTKDVFGYLSNVSREVATELDQKLSQVTSEKLSKVPTSSPAAYAEYLKGCQLFVSRKREDLFESVVKLNKAIALDPEFAAAYANRGQAYHLLGEAGAISEVESVRMTEQNSLTAIRLDPENALAYANLANLYRKQNKWEQARTAYEIAVKYGPNDALVNYWFSLMLRSIGNLKEAVRYSSKAAILDPLHPVIFGGNVLTCVYANELNLAQRNLDEGRVLFHDSWIYYWALAAYFGAKKDYKEAVKNYEKVYELNPEMKSLEFQKVFYQALDGQRDKAYAYLKALPDIPANYVWRAVVYSGLKDKKQSLYYLQKAADLGIIPHDVKVSPFFAIHRGDPHFTAILAKFGL